MIRDGNQFFGRIREIREILSRVATLQSVSLVGERSIGKSSLMFSLTRYGSGLLDDSTIEFHYLDLQPLTAAEEFYEHACELISGQSGKATHEDLEEIIRGKKVVLCLDEFEQTIEAEFGEDFFKSLRSLAQSGSLALIVSTKEPLNHIYNEYQSDLTSSFHNIFTTVYLGEFRPEEAKGFLEWQREREIFTEEECRQIYQLAGNHPIRLNLACSIAFELKQESSKDFANELAKRFRLRLQNEALAKPEFELSESNISVYQKESASPSWTRVLALILVGMVIGAISAPSSNLLGIALAGGFIISGLIFLFFNERELRRQPR